MTGAAADTVAQPVKYDNEAYVRDYARCILCYKCVEACGEDAQNTFAIAVAGRGFDARISTEFDVTLPDSACVYCGNCIGVCPTGALMPASEYNMRQAGTWDESAQTVTETICPYCGVGCNVELHVQDNTIVKVTSPARQRGHPRPPLRQGPLRLRIRPAPPPRITPPRPSATPGCPPLCDPPATPPPATPGPRDNPRPPGLPPPPGTTPAPRLPRPRMTPPHSPSNPSPRPPPPRGLAAPFASSYHF